MLRQVSATSLPRGLIAFHSEHRFAKADREPAECCSGPPAAPVGYSASGSTDALPHLRSPTERSRRLGLPDHVDVRATDLRHGPLEIAVVPVRPRDPHRVAGAGRRPLTVETPARPRRVELNAHRDLLVTVTGS